MHSPGKQKDLPVLNILNWLKKQKTFVFLESTKRDVPNRFSYIFVHPLDVIQCYRLDKIKDAFAQLQNYLNQGYYAAGFFSYETGYGFENLYQAKKNYRFPLIWLGIFKERIVLPSPLKGEEVGGGGKYRVKNLRLNISKKDYLNSIAKIKDFIRAGETYQVNYTMKYKFDFEGSPYKLYQTLRNNQSVSYSAFIKTKDFKVLSFSPELFFRKKGDEISVKPMKGTMERGRNTKEDRINKSKLKFDIKNNAENIMIVDLLRNDLGVVSQTGSVEVPNIFTVEKYETLFQMTSTVKSRLKENLSLYGLFSAIFLPVRLPVPPKSGQCKSSKNWRKRSARFIPVQLVFSPRRRKRYSMLPYALCFLKAKRQRWGLAAVLSRIRMRSRSMKNVN